MLQNQRSSHWGCRKQNNHHHHCPREQIILHCPRVYLFWMHILRRRGRMRGARSFSRRRRWEYVKWRTATATAATASTRRRLCIAYVRECASEWNIYGGLIGSAKATRLPERAYECRYFSPHPPARAFLPRHIKCRARLNAPGMSNQAS